MAIRYDRTYRLLDQTDSQTPIDITDVINNQITYGGGSSILGGVGGGGNPSLPPVSVGGGSNVFITNKPGTIVSNQNIYLNINSNVAGASIYINGEDTKKTTKDLLQISVSDILINGAKKITVKKDGYESPDVYTVQVVQNPNYQSSTGDNLNFASSILGGMGGNSGISGLDFFRSLPQMDSTNPVYTNTPIYALEVRHTSNGFDQSYKNDYSNVDKVIDFTLSAIKILPIEDTPVSQITISVTGPDNSVNLVLNEGTANAKSQKLKSGLNLINISIGDTVSLASSDISSFRIKNATVTKANQNKLIEAQSNLESVSTKFKLDSIDYSVLVTSQNALPATTIPQIDLLSNISVRYNINTKTDIPVKIAKSSNVLSVRSSIANKTFTYSNLGNDTSAIIVLPASNFTRIGNYKVYLVASGENGDGNTIELNVNVVDEVYVGVPDIRNISYPSLIHGPDFKGADVDFTISYQSINTDYVRIYKTGSDKYIQAVSSGDVTLNFLKLLQLDSTQTSENQDLISIGLSLIPYNISGKEVITGKEERLTIQLDKGDLTIPRDVAVSRIADGFINQFDSNIFADETSKYLTHFLNIGNGDNKLITTWTGSLGSLILKLYEPIPTTVQPNDLVWISKIQSNPIVETITVSGIDETYCAPLKGPNFTIEPDNGYGYQVYEDLIASGSVASTNLITKYLSSTGIDTAKLNISYVSSSNYLFENFSNFGSAEERINNFFYKVQILETYKTKYEDLIADTFIGPYGGFEGGILTEDGYQAETEDGIFDIQWEQYQYKGASQQAEAKKYYDLINQTIRAFDGYEKFLYSSNNDLAYPKKLYIHPISGLGTYILKPTTDIDVIGWYESLVQLSYDYDKYNPNYLVNNIPEFVREDYDNEDFITFLNMIGQHFDILWCYINALKHTKLVEEKQVNGISDELVKNLLQSFGWENRKAFNSQFLWEYAFGTDKDGFPKYSMSLEEANNQVWRRILNNLPYILKHKGTGRAMKTIMACYGVPQSMLTIMEFGGPQDPTKGGTTQFTFDDRTAAIYLSGSLGNNGSSNIKVPWKSIEGNYPDCIEFNILPAILPNTKYSLVSGSQWTLDLIQTTGSFGRLELNFGGVLSNSTYFEVTSSGNEYITSSISYVLGPDYKVGSLDFPISLENYSHVGINRHNNPDSSSWFEIWLNTSDGRRITTSVSMSIATLDSEWETGSFLQIGGNGFEGTLDEFRIWRTPLQKSKFDNHTLHPNAIDGNHISASTEDLYFRLDFEYPKDRTVTENNGIKNVSVSDNYGEDYGYINTIYSASSYPYQYIPYDRTVTANVPSLGLAYSNKIRFEDQTLIGDLSYKARATQKAFDRAPIDSNRLGLFFSPIKELNMDILKTFGDFNIDNYIGDPSDEYKENYKELDTLRHYYFERLQNRDIYEYINLVRYIDKSLFEVLTDLAPARAKVSKGLLIEPHYLERNKTRWDKPIAENEYKETFIDYTEYSETIGEVESRESDLDAHEYINFDNSLSDNETVINAEEIYTLTSENDGYESLIADNLLADITTEVPMYDAAIQIPTGSTLSGEADVYTFTEIGMDKNSLANAGYGLYAVKGNGIVRKWDGVFGNNQITGSRSSIFLVKQQKQKNISTQVSGYPTGSGPVVYEKIPVTYNQYIVSIQPFSGSVSLGNDVVEVTPLNGYFKTHYQYVNNNSLGLQYSYWYGSQQNATTTPDGLSPVETFTTNPNILKVAKTGRGSGEPILVVN